MTYERKVSGKAGLPPGVPVYVGDTPPHITTLSLLTYSDHALSRHDSLTPQQISALIHPGDNAWIRISGLDDVSQIEKILSTYTIHPLIIEDILTLQCQVQKRISIIISFDLYISKYNIFAVLTGHSRMRSHDLESR